MDFEAYSSQLETEEANGLLDTEYEPISDYWDGNNIICCKGACIGGPAGNVPVTTCVIFFIAAGGGLYYSVIAPFLWQNISVFLPIIWSVLYACLWISYFLTMCTDPGIIPRRKFFEITPDA